MAFRGRNEQQFNEFFGKRARSAPPHEEYRVEEDAFASGRQVHANRSDAGRTADTPVQQPRNSGRSEAVRRRFEPGYDGSRIHQPDGRFQKRGAVGVKADSRDPASRQRGTGKPENIAVVPYNSAPQLSRQQSDPQYSGHPGTPYRDGTPNTPPPSGNYGFEYDRRSRETGKRIFSGIMLTLLALFIIAVVIFALRPKNGGDYFQRNNALPQATGVRQTQAFRHSALLDWDPVADVAGYRIYRVNESTGQYEPVKTAYLSFAFLGDLGYGSSGTYVVRPFCKTGSGEYVEQDASQVTVKTLPGNSGELEHKTATAHTVTLEWLPAAGADGYEIQRSTGSWNKYALCCDSEQAEGVIHGLDASTEYKFRMRPYIQLEGKRCYGGWSDKFVSATSPETVMGLSQGDTTDSGYMLSWTIDSAATGFEVYRVDPETGDTTELIGQSGTTGYEISGLESVNISSYRVRAFLRHSGGVSYGEYSDVLTAVTLPTQVKNLDQYTSAGGNYTISWDPSERTEGYEVYAYRFTTGDYELLATVADSSYTLTGLSECAERYKVRAYVSLGDLKFFGNFSEPMASHPFVYLTRKVTVDKNTTPLRTGAGPDFELIKDIRRGTVGRVFGEKSGSDGERWFRVELSDGMTGWIARADVTITNSFKTLDTREYTEQSPIVIYLSPSKQGGNPYCIGNTTEKEQMEAVAAVTHRILKEEYKCVVYTATPELELRERAFEAMELKADIYLAIHSNATGTGDVHYGASSYYCAASARSKKLGENVNRELNAIAPKKCTLNKQMYSAMDSFGGVGYAEIRDPYNLGLVPVLAETDFHDNELTAQWIMDNHEAIGRAYANALAETFDIPKK